VSLASSKQLLLFLLLQLKVSTLHLRVRVRRGVRIGGHNLHAIIVVPAKDVRHGATCFRVLILCCITHVRADCCIACFIGCFSACFFFTSAIADCALHSLVSQIHCLCAIAATASPWFDLISILASNNATDPAKHHQFTITITSNSIASRR
jgi:hypothetical protein